jgi:hypothetical protein
LLPVDTGVGGPEIQGCDFGCGNELFSKGTGVGEFDKGSGVGVAESFLTNFDSSHVFKCFGIALGAVAYHEAIFAVGNELVSDILRVVYVWFRDSLNPARCFTVGGVEDFAPSGVNGRNDKSVRKSSGKGR